VRGSLAPSAWTYWGLPGIERTYFKFEEVSSIPQDAKIISASFTLYGVSSAVHPPQGNSFYPGSPYNSFGTNETWLKRVTGNWDETTITWSNKPGATDLNKVALPASTSQWNFDVADIDVTKLVRDMVANGENYGFCLEMQQEQDYRSIVFGGSRSTDSTKRPKLVVEYEEH